MTAGTGDLDELRARAERWLADDPDPASRTELQNLLDGLPGSRAELADRFAGTLAFGTAGLRGPLRAGPNGMNLAVVTRAAAGLVGWLAAREAPGPLIIGYDARHGSRTFAERTAQVATGAGRPALLLPRPLPTPILAYAVRALDGVAGVMVTASHNPPRDNGYKVYLGAALGGPRGAGAQIVTPVDAEIEAAIRAVGPLLEVPLGPAGGTLDDRVTADYVAAATGLLRAGTDVGTTGGGTDDGTGGTGGGGTDGGADGGGTGGGADGGGARELVVAYTALHGVGAAVLTAAFARAGFAVPGLVADQVEPDPDFPTVAFPNPEEPGAVDRLVKVAGGIGADLAIANDPDADRCAVVVPDPGAGGGWRMLRGDEVGVLLADHLMRRGVHGLYATTIVSSALLGRICRARGLPYAETLTGFKWIVRATAGDAPLVYGYEEALGYCVAPDLVRDKDGITAALTVAELAAGLKAQGRTLADRLDELAVEFGLHLTDQLSVRVDDLAEITSAMARVRARPPAELLGVALTGVEDLAPDADVLILRTAAARVVIRPSGTEPKLKAYLEVVEPVGAAGELPAAHGRAAAALADLRAETAAVLGLS
ncbi:phospho-sugar mutase [Solwaraspora sp. WMMD1047]|nr:phospho-sugar mutase [Solwaraspora sp. WMMD1047]MDG4833347.1 phospho-sugar mutase [Solwaraspora sp. WMMD1047]